MTGSLAHGMGLDLVPATWPALTPDEVTTVFDAYSLGRPGTLEAPSPRPFAATTAVGPVVIKRHHPAVRDAVSLAAEHRFMAHLRDAGAPVPTVLRQADGTTTLARDGWVYEVHTRAEGEDRYVNALAWTPMATTGEARAAGVALAHLHDRSQGHTERGRPAGPLACAPAVLAAPDAMAAVEAGIEAHEGVRRYVQGRPGWQAEVAAAFAGRPGGLAPGPPLWIHGDWHASNLLWRGDDVAAVIDFGLAARASALHDLALALERNVVGWLALPEGRPAVDHDHARALLAGYRSVRTVQDPSVLADLLAIVHVPFALAELDYFVTVTEDRADADAAWRYLVDHAAWFATEDGRRLLDTVADAG